MSSLKVSMVSILKAMAKANCNLVQVAKDSCVKVQSFLKVLNSMAEYRPGSNVKGWNRTDLLEYSLMMVLNKSDSSSYNCSRESEPKVQVFEVFRKLAAPNSFAKHLCYMKTNYQNQH